MLFLLGGFLFPSSLYPSSHYADFGDGSDYLDIVDELVHAANEYDTYRIQQFMAEQVSLGEFQTGKFLIGVLMGLAEAINTEITVSDCDSDNGYVSCEVEIMTDLHRAAGHPPAAGLLNAVFEGTTLVAVEDTEGVIDESLDDTSDVFREWLKFYYPPQEENIWNDDGEVANFVGYVGWAVYWVKCQLYPNDTPRCPQ